MIESLNNYAGLFSLLAVLVSFFVPIVIYKKERKAKRLAMKDELEAMQDNSRFPMSQEKRKYFTRKRTLEKGLKRK